MTVPPWRLRLWAFVMVPYLFATYVALLAAFLGAQDRVDDAVCVAWTAVGYFCGAFGVSALYAVLFGCHLLTNPPTISLNLWSRRQLQWSLPLWLESDGDFGYLSAVALVPTDGAGVPQSYTEVSGGWVCSTDVRIDLVPSLRWWISIWCPHGCSTDRRGFTLRVSWFGFYLRLRRLPRPQP